MLLSMEQAARLSALGCAGKLLILPTARERWGEWAKGEEVWRATRPRIVLGKRASGPRGQALAEADIEEGAMGDEACWARSYKPPESRPLPILGRRTRRGLRPEMSAGARLPRESPAGRGPGRELHPRPPNDANDTNDPPTYRDTAQLTGRARRCRSRGRRRAPSGRKPSFLARAASQHLPSAPPPQQLLCRRPAPLARPPHQTIRPRRPCGIHPCAANPCGKNPCQAP